ncbi:MAG: hypothetical protein RTU30_02235 [Candidatus Thorarchaeota archaeon]
MGLNLFQACLRADEKAAADLVTGMVGAAQPLAIWAILMHASSWHEQTEFDTPHSTIMTHSIRKMIEAAGSNPKILPEDPSKTLIDVPEELKDLLQISLLQRLARYLAAVDHWRPERGPRYNIESRPESLDNILHAFTQAAREQSHSGAFKESIILADKDEPIRLIRRTASLAAENPDNLGHAFIMPVSLLLELPEARFKLPHKGALWHLTEYLVRKVPSKKPDGMVAEEDFRKMAKPTDVSKHADLFTTAAVKYGILGHNGIFAHRIVEAASLGMVSSTTVDWLLKRLEKNIGSKTMTKKQLEIGSLLKKTSKMDWDEQPGKVGLPHSKMLRIWLQENASEYYGKMMDLKSATFEESIPNIKKKGWPLVRASQYAMSTINGTSRAAHVIIFTQSIWSLVDMRLISEPVAALQVHRMLRQYLKDG